MRRQTTKRSVLADSSDLGIYGEALGSDIEPGCFMCTAHGSLKGTEIPCAQQIVSKNVSLQHEQKNKCKQFYLPLNYNDGTIQQWPNEI